MNFDILPTAHQMRKSMVSLVEQEIEDQLTKLKNDLLEPPNTGCLNIEYHLHAVTIQALMDRGYSVVNHTRDGNHSFTITW